MEEVDAASRGSGGGASADCNSRRDSLRGSLAVLFVLFARGGLPQRPGRRLVLLKDTSSSAETDKKHAAPLSWDNDKPALLL